MSLLEIVMEEGKVILCERKERERERERKKKQTCDECEEKMSFE